MVNTSSSESALTSYQKCSYKQLVLYLPSITFIEQYVPFSQVCVYYSLASKKRGVYCFSFVCPPVRKPIFSITLSSATRNHSHLELGMVLQLEALHVSYRFQVGQLFTSCLFSDINGIVANFHCTLWGYTK